MVEISRSFTKIKNKIPRGATFGNIGSGGTRV